MKKNYLLIGLISFISSSIIAQNNDVELASYKAEIATKKEVLSTKQTEVNTLSFEIDALQKKIDMISGWRINANGIIGFTLASSNNWAKQSNPNSKISNITFIYSGTALLNKAKYFWRNEGNINVGWQQTILNNSIENVPDSIKDYQSINDALTLTSLFGYKITQDIAASVLGQYSSSLVNNFNDPGIFDIGVGATWTPNQLPNLVFTFHPLNYHIVFRKVDSETQSALGTKIFASYLTKIGGKITWKTDLSGFLEYESSNPSLNEYTWNNQISLNVWKGIGIGLGFSIRNAEIESKDLQSMYNVGLSYNF